LRASAIVNTSIGDREHPAGRGDGTRQIGIVNISIGIVNASIGHREHFDRGS